MRQLAGALLFLHQRELYHRDLKPANIMLHRDNSTGEETIKIIDLGAVAISGAVTDGLAGTVLYSAPEVCHVMTGESVGGTVHSARDDAYNPAHADMFSLGAILFVLLSGVEPFGTAEAWADCDVSFDNPVWGAVSAGAKDLIVRLCDPNPHRRPDCLALLTDPWMQGGDEGGSHASGEIDLSRAVHAGVRHLNAKLTYTAQKTQWKVMNVVQTEEAVRAHHISVQLVDNATFQGEYFHDDPLPIEGNASAAVAARAMGMHRFRARAEEMLKVGQEEKEGGSGASTAAQRPGQTRLETALSEEGVCWAAFPIARRGAPPPSLFLLVCVPIGAQDLWTRSSAELPARSRAFPRMPCRAPGAWV
jgi:hypothetical protein